MNYETNECPNATLHGTKVTEMNLMNLIRKELWELLGSYENIKLSSDIIRKIIDVNFNKSSDYICYINLSNRNINITNDPNHGGSYWKVARQFDIENVLRKLIGNADKIVLQGEILGEGIQGNKYKVKGYDFYAFNLIYPNRKVPTDEMTEILTPFGIKSVKIVEKNFKLKNSIAEMVEYAKGNSLLLPSQKREGVVIRNYQRDISFKVINPEFLLAEKD